MSSIDWDTIPNNVSSLLEYPKLLESFFYHLITKHKVQKGVYISVTKGKQRIEAMAMRTDDGAFNFDYFLETGVNTIDDYVSASIVKNVVSSQSTFVIDSSQAPISQEMFDNKKNNQILLICHPIVIRNSSSGVFYFECNTLEKSNNEKLIEKLTSMSFMVGSLLKKLDYCRYLEKQNENYISELIQARRQSRQAVNSRNLYINNICQEIQAPINSILGFCDYLVNNKKSLANGHKTDRYLTTIQSSARNINELTTNLMDLVNGDSHSNRQPRENIKVKLLIQGIFHLLKEKAVKKGIGLMYYFDDDIPISIHWERSRINLILTNLIRYLISNTASDRTIIISVLRDNHNILFEISNNHAKDVSTDQNIKTGNGPVEKQHLNLWRLDPSHLSKFSAIEESRDGSMKFYSLGKSDLAAVFSISIRAKTELDRKREGTYSDCAGEFPEFLDMSNCAPINKQMIADIEALAAIPIYKGGTLRSMIREISRKYGACGGNNLPFFQQIEEAVFDGNAARLNQLIKDFLKNSDTPGYF